VKPPPISSRGILGLRKRPYALSQNGIANSKQFWPIKTKQTGESLNPTRLATSARVFSWWRQYNSTEKGAVEGAERIFEVLLSAFHRHRCSCFQQVTSFFRYGMEEVIDSRTILIGLLPKFGASLPIRASGAHRGWALQFLCSEERFIQ
jgi:hypothetical protein